MIDASPVPKRPGGLVAVAVLNIVFACIGMFAGFGLHALNSDADEMARQADQMDRVADKVALDHPENAEMNRAMVHSMAADIRETSPQAFRIMFAAGMSGGVLLLASGIGLLGQRRVLGRHGASAAAVALIVCGGVAVSQLSIMFWGFPLIGAAYAIVLICLVNFVFKRNLVR